MARYYFIAAGEGGVKQDGFVEAPSKEKALEQIVLTVSARSNYDIIIGEADEEGKTKKRQVFKAAPIRERLEKKASKEAAREVKIHEIATEPEEEVEVKAPPKKRRSFLSRRALTTS